jgi:hypothetical protein
MADPSRRHCSHFRIQSAAVTLLARSLGVALTFLVLSSPSPLQRWSGGDTRAYIAATLVLALLNVVLVFSWTKTTPVADIRTRDGFLPSSGRHYVLVGAVAAVVGALLVAACRTWLHQVLTIPIDAWRADMLVVVEAGLRRAFQGLNPYIIYHVPWPVPLPYGPLLWGPYAVPMLMRADVRFLTVAGELFVPVLCAAAAIVSILANRMTAAIGCLLMLGAIVTNYDLEQFSSIGHTPVYWPLLALFALLVARERWDAASVSLGLLVISRSTMVTLVPVLLMTVRQRDRGVGRALILVILSAALPLLPFAVSDARALVYALYGSYQSVMKEYVWLSTTWVQHTIGVTGVLLAYHLQRWVEKLQLAVMAMIYLACWFGLRGRRAPVALMGFALLAFSMTTLWPVTYLYFDVFLLLTVGVVADMPGFIGRLSTISILRASAAALVASVGLVTAGSWMMLPSGVSETRTVTWKDDPRVATVVLLRRRATAALVEIDTVPVPADPSSATMNVALNGTSLGLVRPRLEGDRITLAAPARLWRIGTNSLDVAVASPIAIGRVTVRPSP